MELGFWISSRTQQNCKNLQRGWLPCQPLPMQGWLTRLGSSFKLVPGTGPNREYNILPCSIEEMDLASLVSGAVLRCDDLPLSTEETKRLALGLQG